MKKILLGSVMLTTALTNAQTLFMADFETPTYSLGNFVGALESGTVYACQNNFKVDVASTGLTAANIQIEPGTTTNVTNVLRLTGWPMVVGDAPKSHIFKFDFSSLWSGNGTIPKTRLDGHHVVELEFDVWIPGTTSSRNVLNIKINDNSGKSACSIGLTPRSSTTTIRGISYPGGTATNISNATFGPPKQSWQHVVMTYDSSRAEMQVQFNGMVYTAVTNAITPAVLDILLESDVLTANVPATTMKLDNIVLRATAKSVLSTQTILPKTETLAMYINAMGELEIPADKPWESIEIYSLTGQLMASKNNSQRMDISALEQGTYVAKYSDDKQTYSRRFLK